MMPQYLTAILLVAAGLLAGLPTGYVLHGDNPLPAIKNPDALQITFHKDYFDNLPKDKNSEARLLNVGKFTFDTNADGVPDPESEITMPLIGVNDIPESLKADFIPSGE